MTASAKVKDAAQGSGMVAHALRYVRFGLPVFPCKRKTKAPLVKKGFKAATRNEQQINDWWAEWPDAMIGVPTGPSSGIDVIDIDVKPQEFIDGFAFLPQWKSLSPVIVATPSGGAHLWFRSDGNVRNSTDRLAPGIDTRGDGGYVIVPPSRNMDRAGYEFLRGSIDEFNKLPSFPTALLSRIGQKHLGQSSTEPEADPAKVSAAMAVILNDDLGWDDWKRLGLAVFRSTYSINGRASPPNMTKKTPEENGRLCIVHHPHALAQGPFFSKPVRLIQVGGKLLINRFFMPRALSRARRNSCGGCFCEMMIEGSFTIGAPFTNGSRPIG